MIRRPRTRRPRRRARRARIPLNPSSGSRMINKVYRYQFSPQEQYLVSGSTGTIGTIVLTGGTAPLNSSFITSPVPSATGILNTFDFGVGVKFQLADMLRSSAFTSIYDNYRLKQVHFSLEDMTGGALEGSYQVNPTVYAFVDQDDSNAPASSSAITGRQGHKVWTMNNKNIAKYSINIRPKPSLALYASTDNGLGAGQASTRGWLDCATPQVNHYGLKLWFTDVYLGGTNVNVAAFRVKCNYVFEFKGAMGLD